MKLKPHLLDQWLQGRLPVEFNLGSSTGPPWRLREVLKLGDEDVLERLLNCELVYSRTAGSSSLREAIAEMLGVPSEEVLILTGGAEALLHVFLLAAVPGANVMVPFPGFPSHAAMPELFGLEVRYYRLRRENRYQVELDEVKRLADAKTKIVVVNSPHNPTGTTLVDTEMRALHDFAVERGIQLVCDEVYHPIYHGRDTASAACLPYATVIGDLSKALSLAGLRVGWIVERDPVRRRHYLNAREYFTVSNTPLAEICAEIAVRHRDKVWARTRAVASANLKLLESFIAEHSNVLDWVRPGGGMICFPWLVSGEDARSFCEAAAKKGLLLVPGDCFDVPEHFRLGFGVSRDWFPLALQRLAEFLQSRA